MSYPAHLFVSRKLTKGLLILLVPLAAASLATEQNRFVNGSQLLSGIFCNFDLFAGYDASRTVGQRCGNRGCRTQDVDSDC